LNREATAGILNDKFPEADNLVTVTQKNPEHPGYHYCSFTLGRMIARSVSHGPHFCFLFEPMGPDLYWLQRQQPNGVFPVSVTKKIIKQTLLALDYTHTECGLVHTGTILVMSIAKLI
jgi:serine/threonine-protein kinase SRPK3